MPSENQNGDVLYRPEFKIIRSQRRKLVSGGGFKQIQGSIKRDASPVVNETITERFARCIQMSACDVIQANQSRYARIELNDATVLFCMQNIFIVLHLYVDGFAAPSETAARWVPKSGAAVNAGRYAAALWESGEKSMVALPSHRTLLYYPKDQ